MSESQTINQVCIIIGASHAGVNCAFALRKEGWEGQILVYDADPQLPYHRPPLSKGYLVSNEGFERNLLMPPEAYDRQRIILKLGTRVKSINRTIKSITLEDHSIQKYDKLILATGARPFIPAIPGIDQANNLFPMRTAQDALDIRNTFERIKTKRVLVIGGGYIGLETAASLRKLGAEVTLLERENRLLARVTAPEMSEYFRQLHTEKGVQIFTNKNVTAIQSKGEYNKVICDDQSIFKADMIVIGVGIRVNKALAEEAGLTVENGIKVDASARTSDQDIFAIGDCTYHFNPHYNCFLRLESVQNAVDQAKVAAAAISGKNPVYNTIPWFWSDQYDVKLQMVGLSNGYNQTIIRKEEGEGNRFSVWYFKDHTLLAVDAINNPKAYVLGTKFIKNQQKIDKSKLVDSSVAFKPQNLLVLQG